MQLGKDLPKLSRDNQDSESSDEEDAKGGSAKMKARAGGLHGRKRKLLLSALKPQRELGQDEQKMQRLLQRYSNMQFSTLDRREAAFPVVRLFNVLMGC